MTEQMLRTLDFIKAYKATRRIAPSIREIADHLGLKSLNRAHRLLKALEERGKIKRLPRRARAIEVIE